MNTAQHGQYHKHPSEILLLVHDEGLSENILLLLEAVGRVQIIKYHQGSTQSCTNYY